jgi:heme-degrading monooxygenase HmoA
VLTTGDSVEGEKVYARVVTVRFPVEMRAEVVRVAQGLTPVLSKQRGFNGLQLLTDPNAGEGIIITLWETEEAAKASEASSSYIGQMSMMSSFLYGRLTLKTYELNLIA